MEPNPAKSVDVDLEAGPRFDLRGTPSSPSPQSTFKSGNTTLHSTSPLVDRRMIEGNLDESLHDSETPSGFTRFLRAIISKRYFKASPEPFKAIVRKLERCEDGYPYLAAFLDSDENFMIYRRFGFIHARLLLQKQDELRLMEKELDDMDMRDLLNNTRTIKCRTRDINRTDNPAGKETRQQLLARMEDTVLKYDALLLNAQQLASSNRPPAHDYNSVANFVRYKKPLLQGDDDFIYCKEDLITLRPGREHAWLDRAVEKFIKIFPRSAVKYVFCSKETALKTTDEDLFLPTRARVDRLTSGIIMIAVLALLIVPVWGLSHIGSSFNKTNANTSNAICMGLLLVATLLFSAALALFTKAKRHELLGASAAYCALLVVFIANVGIDNTP